MFNFDEYPFLQYEIFGNTVGDFIVATVVFLVLLGSFKLFQVFVLGRLKRIAIKTPTEIDDTLIKIINSVRPPFYFFIAFYLAVRALSLAPFVTTVINIVIVVWVVYQIVISAQIFIDYLFRRLEKREDEDSPDADVGSRKMAIQLLGRIAKGALWVVAILMVLSNLGVNVTSVIAGLGIGGIAVAFALQGVLGDLFSAFVIYFDKPFVVGDFVIVGDSVGTIERIGIKTTRIRSLQGEEIVISNQTMTSSRLQNFKKMRNRRIVFEVGVEYGTPQKKLEKIPEIIKETINSTKDVKFDRAHMKDFGDSAFVFEAVYNVTKPDFGIFRDRHQEILFGIRKSFQKEKIEFAFPTRTVHLVK